MAQNIQLQNTFSGPLDLLLYLVRRDEIDIHDIPIAHVTREYLNEVNRMTDIDIDAGGEFLAMASMLAEIKGRMLLPEIKDKDEDEDELYDPRQGLVEALLEYKKFKEIAAELEKMSNEFSERFSRNAEIPQFREIVKDQAEQLGALDLLAAFQRIARRMLNEQAPREIVSEEVPTEIRIQQIEEVVCQRKRASFTSILSDSPTEDEMVGFFIAILELIRLRKIVAQQSVDFSEIYFTAYEDHEKKLAKLNSKEDDIPAEQLIAPAKTAITARTNILPLKNLYRSPLRLSTLFQPNKHRYNSNRVTKKSRLNLKISNIFIPKKSISFADYPARQNNSAGFLALQLIPSAARQICNNSHSVEYISEKADPSNSSIPESNLETIQCIKKHTLTLSNIFNLQRKKKISLGKAVTLSDFLNISSKKYPRKTSEQIKKHIFQLFSKLANTRYSCGYIRLPAPQIFPIVSADNIPENKVQIVAAEMTSSTTGYYQPLMLSNSLSISVDSKNIRKKTYAKPANFLNISKPAPVKSAATGRSFKLFPALALISVHKPQTCLQHDTCEKSDSYIQRQQSSQTVAPAAVAPQPETDKYSYKLILSNLFNSKKSTAAETIYKRNNSCSLFSIISRSEYHRIIPSASAKYALFRALSTSRITDMKSAVTSLSARQQQNTDSIALEPAPIASSSNEERAIPQIKRNMATRNFILSSIFTLSHKTARRDSTKITAGKFTLFSSITPAAGKAETFTKAPHSYALFSRLPISSCQTTARPILSSIALEPAPIASSSNEERAIPQIKRNMATRNFILSSIFTLSHKTARRDSTKITAGKFALFSNITPAAGKAETSTKAPHSYALFSRLPISSCQTTARPILSSIALEPAPIASSSNEERVIPQILKNTSDKSLTISSIFLSFSNRQSAVSEKNSLIISNKYDMLTVKKVTKLPDKNFKQRKIIKLF